MLLHSLFNSYSKCTFPLRNHSVLETNIKMWFTVLVLAIYGKDLLMPSIAGGGRGQRCAKQRSPCSLEGMNKTSTKKITNCDKRVKEKDRETWVIKKEEVTGAGGLLSLTRVITELKTKEKKKLTKRKGMMAGPHQPQASSIVHRT